MESFLWEHSRSWLGVLLIALPAAFGIAHYLTILIRNPKKHTMNFLGLLTFDYEGPDPPPSDEDGEG